MNRRNLTKATTTRALIQLSSCLCGFYWIYRCKRIVNAIPFGIEKYSEIQKRKENSNDLSKDTRWFENDLMTSADGISFAFTTQIGRHNIGAIIDFATSQGYTVEPIK